MVKATDVIHYDLVLRPSDWTMSDKHKKKIKTVDLLFFSVNSIAVSVFVVFFIEFDISS